MNYSTDNVNSGETIRRSAEDALSPENPVAVDLLIAQVLWRAHREAEDLHAPSEARMVLQMAHAFADELASTDPRFDRTRFIRSAIDDSSLNTRSSGRSSAPQAQSSPAPPLKSA